MVSTLHTVNRSPAQSSALQSCLRAAADNSSVLLMEDAVYCALQVGTEGSASTISSLGSDSAALRVHLARLNWFVLENDLKARGLLDRALFAEFRCVDYTGFVRLTTTHERFVAWH